MLNPIASCRSTGIVWSHPSTYQEHVIPHRVSTVSIVSETIRLAQAPAERKPISPIIGFDLGMGTLLAVFPHFGGWQLLKILPLAYTRYRNIEFIAEKSAEWPNCGHYPATVLLTVLSFLHDIF